MKRRGVHWLWRAAIAMAAAYLVSGLAWDFIETTYRAATEWSRGRIPLVGEDDAVLVPLVIILPALLLAFVIYGLLTLLLGPRGAADGETRCRKCGYILRGIREPRCPECGERI